MPVDASIVNTAFIGNYAKQGGAVYGCRFDVPISLEIAASTFVDNTALQNGGGIYMDYPGELTLLNSIVFNEEGDNFYFHYSDYYYTPDNYFGRNNLIGLDPGFVRYPWDGGDGWLDNLQTTDVDESANNDYGDLRPRSDSLVVDAGNSALAEIVWTDADGNPRIVGNSVDLGAYEFQGQIAPDRETPSTVVTTSADVVDSRDQEVSLREAIFYAGIPGLGTVVTFDPELSGETITLDGTALFIDKEVTIDASSVGPITIDGDDRSGVFEVLGNPETPVSLVGLTIANGLAQLGGGIYNNGATLTVTGSTIIGNEAGFGGGIYSCNGPLRVVDSVIAENSASSGGGIVNYDGTLFVSDSLISRNDATEGSGGAIYTANIANERAAATVVNSIVSGNTASRSGGAIVSFDGTYGHAPTTVIQTVFSGNQAGEYGGGIYSGSHDRLIVSGCTFACNGAGENGGGAIYKGGELLLTNSILYANEGGDYIEPTSGNLDGSHNLIGLDPAFVRDPSPGADGVWGTSDDDYGDLRLTGRSPALNVGDADLLPPDLRDLDGDGDTDEPIPFDLDGNPRIFGDSVDIGAYEFQSDPLPGRETPSTAVTTQADIFDPYDGEISLRDAVYYANMMDAGTVVTFAADLDGATLVLDGSAIYIVGDVTIDASATESLTVDGDGRSGVFRILGNDDPDVAFIDLTITGGSGGGGIQQSGGTLTVVGCDVIRNTGSSAGGISVIARNTTIIDSRIVGNTSNSGAGGIYAGGTVTICGCSISGNCSQQGPGAISNRGTMWIDNSTIAGNWGDESVYGFGLGLTVHNTIITGRAITRNGPGEINVSYSLIGDYNRISEISQPFQHNIYGTSNNIVDPSFVRDPSPGEDGTWGTEDDDYGDLRLRIDSPARDLGNNDLLPPDTFDLDGDGDVSETLPVDLAGNPRITNGTVDMGVYESTFVPYIVDSLEDIVAEDGILTLREAIEAANSNAAVGDAHAGERGRDGRDCVLAGYPRWNDYVGETPARDHGVARYSRSGSGRVDD